MFKSIRGGLQRKEKFLTQGQSTKKDITEVCDVFFKSFLGGEPKMFIKGIDYQPTTHILTISSLNKVYGQEISLHIDKLVLTLSQEGMPVKKVVIR